MKYYGIRLKLEFRKIETHKSFPVCSQMHAGTIFLYIFMLLAWLINFFHLVHNFTNFFF